MLLVGLLIVAAAVYLIVRRVEVRLVLLGAGLLMATVAGNPLAVFDNFTQAMVTDRKSTRLNSSHIQKSRMPSSA